MDPVQHFEIPAEDMDRARKFYIELFGWEFRDMEGVEYSMIITSPSDEQALPLRGGNVNGGLFKRTARGQTPLIVITVPSLAEYLDRVILAGGRIVMESQRMGDFGLFAKIEDSEGNIIGLWQDLS